MPPIELGITRAIGAVDGRLARPAGARPDGAHRAETARAPQGAGDALDPGPVPIDAERVAVVRKAVESGTYPVIPATVADAIIAAGLLLRSPK